MESPLKYEKLAPIGAGPECTVYRGRNRDLDTAVAIKELPEALRRNVARRERYYAEAALGAQQRHDCLTAVLDLDRSQGWIIYELLPACLSECIAQESLPPQEVERILTDCLRGLDHIHGQGFLHGNLKPANVLLDGAALPGSRRVKLSDSRYLRQDIQGELPIPRGSHKYMAPELLDDSFGGVGQGVDIYALGIMMIESLLGPAFDRRFRGVVQDVTDAEKGWIRWHTSRDEDPIATAQWAPETPERLATVLDRMVTKDPLQRYASVADIREDLAARDPAPATSRVAPPQSAPPARHADARPAAAPPSMPVRVAPAAPAANPPKATPFKIGPLPAWPDTPVVVRHASGARAGQFAGYNASRVTIGSGLTCDLSFLEDGYVELDELAIEIHRAVNGWTLRRHGKQPVIVNQQPVDQEIILRSGDMVRLGPDGPDFQFLIQVQHQKTLASILAEHAPRALAAAQAAGRRPAPKPVLPNEPSRAAVAAPGPAEGDPACDVSDDFQPSGWESAPSAPSRPPDARPAHAWVPALHAAIATCRERRRALACGAAVVFAAVVTGALLLPRLSSSATPAVRDDLAPSITLTVSEGGAGVGDLSEGTIY